MVVSAVLLVTGRVKKILDEGLKEIKTMENPEYRNLI